MAQRHKKRIDIILALLIIGLVGFGLVMISSSSVVLSYEKYGNNYYYLTKQFTSLLVGLVAMIVLTMLDYHVYKKLALFGLISALVLLCLVLIPGVGKSLQGASRWIHIGPIFFQPSELAKLAFLIYLAAWFDRKGNQVKSLFSGFLPFFGLVMLLAFLILKQPDMGTAVVFVTSVFAVYFAAGAQIYHLVLSAALGISAFGTLIYTSSYRLDRLKVFLNATDESSLGIGYHVKQIAIAIGSGGWLGLGFGESRQKFLYLPEPFTDSIFAISVEELGFFRATLILAVFLLIAYRGYMVAKNAPDNFGKYLAVGITTWLVVQAFLNIGAMLGIIPLTGIPLPFLSYGGSSLVVTLAAAGILLNVSKQARN